MKSGTSGPPGVPDRTSWQSLGNHPEPIRPCHPPLQTTTRMKSSGRSLLQLAAHWVGRLDAVVDVVELQQRAGRAAARGIGAKLHQLA